MITKIFLVRHASHSQINDVLVGRSPGVSLSQAGAKEAQRVAARLSAEGITHVQSSPRERALESAAPIAAQLGLEVETASALDELDFGGWTGRAFSELNLDPAWHLWNENRARARPPGGESMAEAQVRIVEHLVKTDVRAPGARIVMVTHAEIIRAAVLYCLSQTLKSWHAMLVAPGSVTTIAVRAGAPNLMRFNERAAA